MKNIQMLFLALFILILTHKINAQYLDGTIQFVESYPQNTYSNDFRTIQFGLGNITLDATNNFKPDLLQVVNYKLWDPPIVEFHSQCGWYENSGNLNFGGNNQVFLDNSGYASSNIGVSFAKIRSIQVQHPKLKDFVLLKGDALKLFLVNNDASVTEGQSFTYLNGLYLTTGEFNWGDTREDTYVYKKVGSSSSIEIFNVTGDYYPYLQETPVYTISVPDLGLYPKLVVKRINEPDGAYLFGNTNPGKPDLIVKGENSIYIYKNDDNNHLELIKTITPGFSLYDVAVEDVNNDGYNDIILSETYGYPRIQVYLNTNSGYYFGNRPNYTLQNNTAIFGPPSIGIADFNVDGYNDIIITSTQIASIFINQATGFSSAPTQLINHPQAFVKTITTDLNGKGGISLVICGVGAIMNNYQFPYDMEGITRYNPTTNYSNPKPAPPVVERKAYKDGENYHPLIKFNNRSELDFKEYKIYKRLEEYYSYQLVATLSNEYNEFIDYDEIVYEDCILPPSYYTSLVYKVTSSDLDNQESDPSPEMKYRTIQGGDGDGVVLNPETPKEFNLSQNYPNPFNPVTNINFALPKQGIVTLKIYDITGKEIKTLINEVKQAGNYTVDFNGSSLSSGVYFYRIQSNDFVQTKRMVLIK